MKLFSCYTHSLLSGALSVAIIAMVCVASVQADSIRDAKWYRLDSGVDTNIAFLSGSSLDSLYTTSDTAVRMYDSATATWADLQSWSDHFAGNTNWSGVTDVSVASAGDKMYVMSKGSHNQVGYFDGTNWTDITATTRTWSSPMAVNGDTALNIGQTSGAVALFKLVGGEMASGFPKYNMQNLGLFSSVMSIDGNGAGVYWARDNTNKVSRSVDGGLTWTQVESLPASGVSGNYSIHAIDADHAIASAANRGRVYRTSDGGETWEQVGGVTFASGHARGIHVNDWNDIVAFGSFSGLYHWDGDTWSHIELPDHLSSETLRSIAKVDGEYFVAGADGVMYSTVPEPGTLGLIVLGGCGAIIRRKRR